MYIIITSGLTIRTPCRPYSSEVTTILSNFVVNLNLEAMLQLFYSRIYWNTPEGLKITEIP